MEMQRSLSFEEFAEAEMSRLLGLARVLTGNDHDAWDLTQDSLQRLREHPAAQAPAGTRDDARPVRGWQQ